MGAKNIKKLLNFYKSISITGGVVRNLRLTEAVTETALLANSMSGTSLISNITLEGEITNSAQTDDMGSLINKLYGGEVNTVTSMVKITGEITSSGPCVGGIIGSIRSSDTSNDIKASAVTVAYCSNYGPVTINKSGAGGIVGSVAESRGVTTTIDHCFNGSSVLAGYTSTATAITNYAGGIVGNINENTGEENTVKVSNCYNAGIIKAGHKANTSMSYAAGIVAHAKDTNDEGTEIEYAAISNCYNEGSIEALGVDPTTEYVVTGVTYVNGLVSDAEGSKIYLVQTNAKNVSGYHIADIAVTDCAKSDDADLELDGAMLEQKSVTTDANGNITAVKDSCVYGSDDYGYMMGTIQDYTFFTTMSQLSSSTPTAITESIVLYGTGTYKWQIEGLDIYAYTRKLDQSDFSSLQCNKLKIPEIFVDTQRINAFVGVDVGSNDGLDSGTGTAGGWVSQSTVVSPDDDDDIYRNYYYDFSSQISGNNGIITTMENALGASGSTLNEDLQLDKTSFGSNQRDVAQNYDTTIAGQSYRVAYSFDSAFESETYTGTWDYELRELGNFKDLDKLDGKESGWYIISASVGEKDVLNSLNFTVDSSGQNSVKFKYTYRGASLGVNKDSSLSVKMGFRWSVSADISNDTSDYQYINDNTFAINVDGAFTISSKPEPSLDDLAIFIDSNNTLTDQAGQIHYNILKLTSADKEYYFELDTINNRLVYHIGAKLNNTRDVNQKPESTDTILDVVEDMPGTFDNLEFTQTETISEVSLNGHASFEGTVTHEVPVNIAGNTQYEMFKPNVTSSLEKIEEGLWKLELVIPDCTEFFSYSKTYTSGLVAVSVINPNSPMPYAVVEYNNEHLTGIIAIDAGYGNSTGITLSIWTTNLGNDLELGRSTFYGTTYNTAESNKLKLINTTIPKLRCDTTGVDFETDNLPTASNGFSPTYEISIDDTTLGDWNDGVITYDSFLDRNFAYFVGGVDLVYTHRLASVTYSQTDGNPVVYKKGNELAIVNNGGTITANGQDITIYQTYNGTTDRPIKAGDQIVVIYNETYTTGTLEDGGNCLYGYSQAVFNVLFKDNQYVLEFVEGELCTESMKVKINEEGEIVFDEEGEIVISDQNFKGSSQENPLEEGDINTIKAAINIYNNNGTLYIYNIDEDIKISTVDRSSTVPSSTLSWAAGEINKSKQEKAVTIMGLPSNNFTSMNKSVSLSVENESLTISTYFNNAQTQLNIYEYWEASSATEVTGNYGEPDGISYAGIILKNDIFILSDEISLGFNIYGNHHALISNQEGSMFSALGKSAGEGEGEGEGEGVRLENLDIVGTTSQKIFNALKGTNKFYNIDFYGTVYNEIEIEAEESEADGEADDGNTGNKDTIGLYGISGTHVDIYTAIYGKKDVKIFVANMNESQTSSTTPTVQDEGSGGESQPATDDPNTHVKLKGVVFASDGKDGTSDTSATAGGDGKSITLTNTINEMLIAVKAGDAGNGGLTLSSGLPSASEDIKAGGAAGTVTGTSETFASTSGISGGVYRNDEKGNSDTTFKQRAIGAVHTCTDGDGNHVKFGWNNGDRTATGAVNNDAEGVIPDVTMLIESPRSTEFSLTGIGSNFAAYYDGGGNSAEESEEAAKKDEFIYSASRGGLYQFALYNQIAIITHQYVLKYLVLDAAGNSVYSKSSFIAAGEAWHAGLAVVKFSTNYTSELSTFFSNNSGKTFKVLGLGTANKDVEVTPGAPIYILKNSFTASNAESVKTELDNILTAEGVNPMDYLIANNTGDSDVSEYISTFITFYQATYLDICITIYIYIE